MPLPPSAVLRRMDSRAFLAASLAPIGHHGLFQNDLGHLGVLLKVGGQLLIDDVVHQSTNVGIAQLGPWSGPRTEPLSA